MRTDKSLKTVESYLGSEKCINTGKRESVAASRAFAKAVYSTQPKADGLFKRIMVAVDASDQAAFAVDVASRLARVMDSQLILVHVVHVPPPTNPDIAYESTEIRSALLEGGQAMLERIAAQLEPAISVEQILRDGDPATQIVDTATRLGADLIVIGTHGRGRFAQAVIGSVASAVTRKASCPVMVIAHPLTLAGNSAIEPSEAVQAAS